MNRRYALIFESVTRLLNLCEELSTSLEKERSLLVLLRLEEIIQWVQNKDTVQRALASEAQTLKRYLNHFFAIQSPALLGPQLPSDLQPEWEALLTRWQKKWEQTRLQVEENQKFLQLSLKHMGKITDNIRRLLGENLLYSPKGARVETASSGKVLEARV